jgi:hypothetical protein
MQRRTPLHGGFGVGQTHQREARQAVREVDLDLHHGRFKTVDCPRSNYCQRHVPALLLNWRGPFSAAAADLSLPLRWERRTEAVQRLDIHLDGAK